MKTCAMCTSDARDCHWRESSWPDEDNILTTAAININKHKAFLLAVDSKRHT